MDEIYQIKQNTCAESTVISRMAKCYYLKNIKASYLLGRWSMEISSVISHDATDLISYFPISSIAGFLPSTIDDADDVQGQHEEPWPSCCSARRCRSCSRCSARRRRRRSFIHRSHKWSPQTERDRASLTDVSRSLPALGFHNLIKNSQNWQWLYFSIRRNMLVLLLINIFALFFILNYIELFLFNFEIRKALYVTQ